MFAGKLTYLNKAHMGLKAQETKSRATLCCRARDAIVKALPPWINVDLNYVEKVLLLNMDRLENICQFPTLCDYFFIPPNLNSKDTQDMRRTMKKQILGRSFT